MAEGAGFEPAVHGVDAGFQDRWFQPLTHPSDNVFNYLWRAILVSLFDLSICLPICEVPKGVNNVVLVDVEITFIHLDR